jgi:alkylhydroperoxidase family enzyme
MRLPNIPSNQVTSEQRPLFDKLNTGIRENLQDFTTQKPDGSLIGPFNALLHFPAYGTLVWDLFLVLAGNSVLPKAAREVVILATAARFGSLYELCSHEAVAAESGLPASKIRTIAAGLVGQFMSDSGV